MSFDTTKDTYAASGGHSGVNLVVEVSGENRKDKAANGSSGTNLGSQIAEYKRFSSY